MPASCPTSVIGRCPWTTRPRPGAADRDRRGRQPGASVAELRRWRRSSASPAAAQPRRRRSPAIDGEIYTLYVLPDWQEQGIGRAPAMRLPAASWQARPQLGAWLWVLARQSLALLLRGDGRQARRRAATSGLWAHDRARDRLWLARTCRRCRRPAAGAAADERAASRLPPANLCIDPPQRTTAPASMTDRILILDFGSQVTQLIARRVRESGVYCEILPFNTDPQRIADFGAQGHHPLRRPGLGDRGRVAAGAGRSSSSWACRCSASATASRRMCAQLGGEVERSDHREFGRAFVEVTERLRAVRRRVEARATASRSG